MKQPGRYRAIAEYYDAEYETNDVLDNDTPFLLTHLPKRSQRVLELCCGTARCAIPLAQAGHRVTGVDIDADLLAIARRKRDSVGLTDRELSLVRGDVLRYESETKYDWAVLLFNTLLNFPTLPQQDRLLARVASLLRPGGRFWVDVFNPDFSLLAEGHVKNFDPATFYVPALDRTVHRTMEIRQSPEQPQLQHITFHYVWTDTAGKTRREKSAFDATWMLPREVVLLMERHGFRVENLYGDYDGSVVTPESPRIIACGRLSRSKTCDGKTG